MTLTPIENAKIENGFVGCAVKMSLVPSSEMKGTTASNNVTTSILKEMENGYLCLIVIVLKQVLSNHHLYQLMHIID